MLYIYICWLVGTLSCFTLSLNKHTHTHTEMCNRTRRSGMLNVCMVVGVTGDVCVCVFFIAFMCVAFAVAATHTHTHGQSQSQCADMHTQPNVHTIYHRSNKIKSVLNME